ncbi:hypothetical protein [Hymenobacter roseosalivarius]|nr:hypothetical protein [Hymenobacter roseosalivarius]
MKFLYRILFLVLLTTTATYAQKGGYTTLLVLACAPVATLRASP